MLQVKEIISNELTNAVNNWLSENQDKYKTIIDIKYVITSDNSCALIIYQDFNTRVIRK